MHGEEEKIMIRLLQLVGNLKKHFEFKQNALAMENKKPSLGEKKQRLYKVKVMTFPARTDNR